MKTSIGMLVLAAGLAWSPAWAQFTVKTEAERERANLTAEAHYPVIKFESTKTRAEVIAELEAARGARQAQPTPAADGAKSRPPHGNPPPDLYQGA